MGKKDEKKQQGEEVRDAQEESIEKAEEQGDRWTMGQRDDPSTSSGLRGTEVEELEERVREFEEKWKRALADYRNLETRMGEQRSEWIRSANRDLLLRLLPIFDTLNLAHQHTKDKTLEVTIAQFFDILKSEGVTKVETIGKEFDPHLMEVVMTGAGEENKVIEELRQGFMLYDKVLRVAQVKVGHGK